MGPGGQLDDGVYGLAPFLVGNAEYRTIGHFFMAVQDGLDFGRVYVDAARYDHVGPPVHQKQVAILVQVAHVAVGKQALFHAALAFVRVAVVLEIFGGQIAHVHIPDLADRAGVAVGLKNSHGYAIDGDRQMWPFRDWVIKAFNDDMPYDEFARMQLAGDILKPGKEGTAAVGFLVAGTHNTVLGSSDQMKRQARQDELEEIVGTVTQGFLGLTVHCARCHDHKTDPIPNSEYYRVAAALAGVRHGTRHGMFSVRPANPGVMRIHHRGSAGDLGDEVTPGGVAALQGLSAEFKLAGNSSDAQRRQALAAWVTAPANPLFARVIVNRLWHYHFGRGIVETPSDFGAGGGRPSHPELLDWLAGWFRRNSYSLKALHRLIVTSETWRQSSASRPAALARDSGNSLLWRFSPRRVEAEVLRDSILQVAGVLNTHHGGPGYEDVREQHFNAGRYYHPIEVKGAKFNRRTIYRFSPRGARDALLDTFDCPDPSTTSPRRAVTTTPLQALSLSNNPFVWRMADSFAARVRKEAGGEVLRQLELAWRLCFGRPPAGGEISRGRRLVEKQGLSSLCRVLFNSSEFVLIE